MAEVVMGTASKITANFYDKEEPRQAVVMSVSSRNIKDEKINSSSS